jgi:hypothetical protein
MIRVARPIATRRNPRQCIFTMKTKEELQSAVDEIREVCQKHGIVLLGTCIGESIYGEITIGSPEQVRIAWSNPGRMISNSVENYAPNDFFVSGIGDME